jgi:hypothetical protein
MKRLLFLLPLLLIGCRTVYVPVESVHTVTQIVRDTIVQVELITFRDSVSIPDTLSRLENKYAVSYALWSGRRLNHSLSIKDVQIPIRIQYVDITRTDSVQVPYPVEKIVREKYVTDWQRFRLRLLNWLVLAVVLYFGWKYRKPIIAFIRRLIIKV